MRRDASSGGTKERHCEIAEALTTSVRAALGHGRDCAVMRSQRPQLIAEFGCIRSANA
jgi:hypothetical protein